MSLKVGLKTLFTHPYMKRLVAFVVTAILCGFAAFAVLSFKPQERTTTKSQDKQATGMPTSVRSIKPKAYPAIIKSFGEVVPLWQTTIKAQVDGPIVFLSEKLRVGNIVKQGELLAQIEKSSFETQAAEANKRLAEAKVALLKEEREAGQARRNWEQSKIKGDPESPLVLRKPQLEAAQSESTAAQAALDRAKILLRYTDVRAPFDGVIMQCKVSRGETLFTGGEIAVIYDLDAVEVGVHLDETQWALLPDRIENADVRLYDPQGTLSWDAAVVRESRHIDRDSRLRTLFLQVKRPLEQKPPLLPGTFVQAEITGRDIPDLLCIPESALTKQGLVWFADRENRLRPKRSEALFYGEGVVFIRTPDDMEEPMRLVVSPNSSFISGLLIQAIAAKESDQ